MKLPDFLINGAMKAGTTTLYRDLMTNPAIFFPYEKERSDLLRDESLEPAGRAAYAALFKRARPGQLRGSAPSSYTKLPDLPGVVQRAREIHGPELKAIYLVREPVARAVSQHYHEYTAGEVEASVDDVFRRESRFVDYSRYAMQITPWIETFGRERILIIHFEEYIADRAATVDEVCRFLGVEPIPELLESGRAFNRGDAKPVEGGIAEVLRSSRLYRALVRPWLSQALRDSCRRLLLPKALPRPPPPTIETLRFFLDELGDDPRHLAEIMGRDKPLWDFDVVLRDPSARGSHA